MGACHALDPGSIPGRRVFLIFFLLKCIKIYQIRILILKIILFFFLQKILILKLFNWEFLCFLINKQFKNMSFKHFLEELN
jgi:hypothetical protein